MPEFLQLLAQPELAITRNGESIGPMRLEREGDVAVLEPVAPETIGLPEREGRATGLPVRLRALPGPEANAAFSAGEAAALLAQFSIGGWQPQSRIVPPNLPSGGDLRGERWPNLSLDERRARVTEWTRETGQNPRVRLWLPDGPGSDRLLNTLSLDLATIGVELRRVQFAQGADLVMIDRLARYPSSRWFLNQFNCELLPGPCAPDADLLVTESLFARSEAEATDLLVEAEGALIAQEVYIPFGAPVRWSLVRSRLEGFSENPWARHPLYALAGVEAW